MVLTLVLLCPVMHPDADTHSIRPAIAAAYFMIIIQMLFHKYICFAGTSE